MAIVQEPPKDFAKTAEFREAVKLAVDEAIKNTIGALPANSEKSSPELQKLFETMALSIAAISDQGTEKVRVPPDVLVKRQAARELLFDLVDKLQESREVALYTLTNKVYLDEVLVEPIWIDSQKKQRATEIGWSGIPNEAMIPVNDKAKEIFAAFTDSIGATAEVVQFKPLRVTSGGLVIHGDTGNEVMTGVLPEQPGRAPGSHGVGLKVAGEAAASGALRVLGTLHEPARKIN
jgi:hypothetical protein